MTDSKPGTEHVNCPCCGRKGTQKTDGTGRLCWICIPCDIEIETDVEIED